jgi:hypothetical protein
MHEDENREEPTVKADQAQAMAETQAEPEGNME